VFFQEYNYPTSAKVGVFIPVIICLIGFIGIVYSWFSDLSQIIGLSLSNFVSATTPYLLSLIGDNSAHFFAEREGI
jgi:hypothetical protein